MSKPEPSAEPKQQSFADQADEATPSLFAELFAFLRESRKWWLLPILIVLALVGAIVVLSSSSLAPLIYPLF